MKKKRILMIAPQSFPVTGAEAIVNIKLLRALSNSNLFEIDLVSKRDKWSNYKSAELEELGVNLNSLNIVEVDNVINFRTIMQHLMCFLYFGVVFKGSHWAYKALNIVTNLVENNDYDYVLTKNSPSLLLGYYIKNKYGLKWVATWNDPYPEIFYPQPYGKGLNAKTNLVVRKLIKIMQKHVDIHIFPSNRIKNYMQNYLKVEESKIIVSPHVVLNNQVINKKCNCDKLRIIHSGNLKNPRNPHSFLSAFCKFLKYNPDAKIEMTILGVFDDDINKFIIENKLDKHISILKSVSYYESLQELANHHIALIIEANCNEGIFLPTKVSDFMQSGIPIYAIGPNIGVLNDLFAKDYIHYFSPVDDEIKIYNTISSIYSDFIETEGEFTNSPIPASFTEESVVNQYFTIG